MQGDFQAAGVSP